MIDLIPCLTLFDAADFFQWFVENAGYTLVFVFMVIESSFIPFPSEVVVPPAAYLAASRGDLHIAGIVVAATLGALVGALINYYLSLWIGRPLVYRFAESSFGNVCLLNRQKVENAEKYFDRHGAISTFIGRLVPAVRQLISIPAGLARMNVAKFAIFTSLGALVWNIILATLGWWLSTFVALDDLFVQVEKYNHYLTIGGLIIAALCIIFIIWRVIKHRKSHSNL